MANKSISELVSATRVTPTDLFVLEQSGAAKKLTGQILENWLVAMSNGHGGIQSIEKLSTSGLVDTYRITLTDSTTYNFTVTNGRGIKSWEKSGTSGLVDTYTMTLDDGTKIAYTVTNGEPGSPGAAGTVWIKYASQKPTQESHSIGDIPDDWIGICPSASPSAPTDWRKYTWFLWKGRQGEPGEIGKNGLSIFYTSEDKGSDVIVGDVNFNPEFINIVSGSELRVGDMLLTPSGKIFKVKILPHDGMTTVSARYLITIKGNDGLNGQNGLSIFPVNTDSTDVEATFLETDIQMLGRAPQIGDLLLTPNGRVFQIHDSNEGSYSAGFFTSIRGPSGASAHDQEEKELMMALFKNATYNQPMTDTLNTLARLWGFLITVSFYDSLALGGYVGTLECPKGMTWGEFVTSEYNTKGFRFIDRYLHAEDGWLVQGVQRSSTGSYYFTITQDIEVGKFPEYTYDFPNP